jgi:hypothetical protein
MTENLTDNIPWLCQIGIHSYEFVGLGDGIIWHTEKYKCRRCGKEIVKCNQWC